MYFIYLHKNITAKTPIVLITYEGNGTILY